MVPTRPQSMKKKKQVQAEMTVEHMWFCVQSMYLGWVGVEVCSLSASAARRYNCGSVCWASVYILGLPLLLYCMAVRAKQAEHWLQKVWQATKMAMFFPTAFAFVCQTVLWPFGTAAYKAQQAVLALWLLIMPVLRLRILCRRRNIPTSHSVWCVRIVFWNWLGAGVLAETLHVTFYGPPAERLENDPEFPGALGWHLYPVVRPGPGWSDYGAALAICGAVTLAVCYSAALQGCICGQCSDGTSKRSTVNPKQSSCGQSTSVTSAEELPEPRLPANKKASLKLGIPYVGTPICCDPSYPTALGRETSDFNAAESGLLAPPSLDVLTASRPRADKHTQNQAAVLIQRFYQRRRNTTNFESVELQSQSSSERLPQSSLSLHLLESPASSDAPKEVHAATQIQARFRGHQVRKEIGTRKVSQAPSPPPRMPVGGSPAEQVVEVSTATDLVAVPAFLLGNDDTRPHRDWQGMMEDARHRAGQRRVKATTQGDPPTVVLRQGLRPQLGTSQKKTAPKKAFRKPSLPKVPIVQAKSKTTGQGSPAEPQVQLPRKAPLPKVPIAQRSSTLAPVIPMEPPALPRKPPVPKVGRGPSREATPDKRRDQEIPSPGQLSKWEEPGGVFEDPDLHEATKQLTFVHGSLSEGSVWHETRRAPSRPLSPDFAIDALLSERTMSSTPRTEAAATPPYPDTAPDLLQQEARAALQIQAQFRGHKARKEVSQQKEQETQAARQIQTRFREHQQQKQSIQKEEMHATANMQAATQIQAHFRGHKARQEVSVQREEETQAARQIQTRFREHQQQKQSIQKEARAATQIQARFRGHKVRKEVQAQQLKSEDVDNILQAQAERVSVTPQGNGLARTQEESAPTPRVQSPSVLELDVPVLNVGASGYRADGTPLQRPTAAVRWAALRDGSDTAKSRWGTVNTLVRGCLRFAGVTGLELQPNAPALAPKARDKKPLFHVASSLVPGIHPILSKLPNLELELLQDIGPHDFSLHGIGDYELSPKEYVIPRLKTEIITGTDGDEEDGWMAGDGWSDKDSVGSPSASKPAPSSASEPRTVEMAEKLLEEIQALHSRVADFANVEMPAIPNQLLDLQWVQELRCVHNHLKELPIHLHRLVHLHTLIIRHNDLVAVPRIIGCLSKLKYLDLSHNQITHLPLQVAHLSNLRVCRLQDNQLDTVPSGLFLLRELQELNLQHNPKLVDLPPRVEWERFVELNLGLDDRPELQKVFQPDPALPGPALGVKVTYSSFNSTSMPF
mmetsp:Transcript_115166/g.200471  ORF Transcript_115166/g.200471 Transcript_115166/m.200471 type:complete len:1251 (-) Transcript_115166:890-4642(-)